MAPPKSRKAIISRDRKSSRSILLYGIASSVFLFFLSIVEPTLVGSLNNKVYDTLLKSTPMGEPSTVPVIVAIDEESLRQYGQWPWPRYRIATLLDKLRELGALSIGLDILFAEDDRTSVDVIRRNLLHDFGVNLEFAGLPQELRDNDQKLANALSRGTVVLGYQFLFEEDSGSNGCLLHPLHVNRIGPVDAGEDSGLFNTAGNVSCNLKLLSQAAASSGFFNVSTDPDGIVRRVPLIIEHKGRFYPSLSLATLMRALDTNEVFLKTGSNGGSSYT